MLANRRFLTVVIVVGLVVFLFRDRLLTAIGHALVNAEAPEQADAILVLAGDWRGNRIMKACELARDGYAPVVLVSGSTEWYGLNEADQAIRYATANGCPADRLQALHLPALSTAEEAKVLEPELKRRNIQKILIVTSDFHTARAGRTFRNLFQDRIQVRMVAAPDHYFRADSWWRHREGQKTVLFEIQKTIAYGVGL